ncbi:unnamed protein product [Sphagnum tenellum]
MAQMNSAYTMRSGPAAAAAARPPHCRPLHYLCLAGQQHAAAAAAVPKATNAADRTPSVRRSQIYPRTPGRVRWSTAAGSCPGSCPNCVRLRQRRSSARVTVEKKRSR